MDSRAQGIADRVAQKLKSGSDLRTDLTILSNMDMKPLLDVMQALNKAGKLDDFADHVPTEKKRIGAAILTIQQKLDVLWEQLVSKFNEDDRNAILARVPADVRKRFGKGATSPSGGNSKDKDPTVEPGGVIAVGPDGAEVQAKLTFHSDLAANLGETEFTIHIGPNGKLSQFEVDVTAVKAKLNKMGVLSRMLELEATLSLNSTVDLDQKATKVIFGKVQAQVKGEIEAHFKDIKALESVSFKLTATAGSGGFSVTGSIEIRIPGT